MELIFLAFGFLHTRMTNGCTTGPLLFHLADPREVTYAYRLSLPEFPTTSSVGVANGFLVFLVLVLVYYSSYANYVQVHNKQDTTKE